MIRSDFLGGLVLVLSVASAGSASTIFPNNSGFDSPAIAAGGINYQPGAPVGGGPSLDTTPPSWTYVGNTGIAANNGPFSQNSPSGQAGFLQGGHGGTQTISQDLSGVPAGTASVTFSLEERFTSALDSINVSLGGNNLGTYTPAGDTSFNTVTTPTAFLSGGTETLTFTLVEGDTSADNTVSITDVSIAIVPVPEPGTLGTLVLGAIGLFIASRRRKTAR